MATRRARIKAVAALPVRRRNTENSKSDQLDNSSKKQDETLAESEVKVNGNHANISQIETTTASVNHSQYLISPEIEDKREITAEKILDSLENEKGLIIEDDYNPGSVPESITDETLVDGIVPIKSARNAPKNIDLLKSDITDNVEILFDPIVPLPSPSKVRPKLRPVPRLRPNRRNSIQGSASESEDESRRALLSGAPTPTPVRQRHDSHTPHSVIQAAPNREARVRNDSVCSTVSQMTPLANVSSPLKEKIAKVRRDEHTRRLAAMRRLRENVQREKLTMYDLIFYNPITNPMIEDKDELKVKEMNLKCEAEKQEKDVESSESAEEGGGDSAPVPQLKLGPNGEIVIDEKSLVIAQSQQRRIARGVVHEGASGGRVGHYSRSRRTREWRPAETVRFYRALAALGTDFSLMTDLFPDRTRKDLKTKFKKEEKVNPAQIEMALRTPTTWDSMRLSKEFREQRDEELRRDMLERKKLEEIKLQEKERLQRYKDLNMKQSRATKAIGHELEASLSQPNVNDAPSSADEFLQKKLREKRKRRFVPPSDIEEDPVFIVHENFEIRPATTQSKLPQLIPVQSTPPKPNMEKQDPSFATLTLVEQEEPAAPYVTIPINLEHNMATVSRLASGQLNNPTTVTDNIETGSLVLLTVDDPSSTSSKVVQTYISSSGCLTPVTLPQSLWDSMVDYVWKDPLKTDSQVKSNTNTASQEQPSVIQVNPSANNRTKNNST